MACPPPALACALHTNFGVLDQPGRTLVRRVDAQAAATRRSPIHGGTRGRYHRLHRRSQRKSQTLQMGQISRRNTRRRQTLLPKNNEPNFRFRRSEEHTSELTSLMSISYAVF